MSSAQDLIARFSDMKTISHVVARVNQLAASDTSTMQDFEEVIRLDPVLVTRLLRLVNSSYFALSNKIESISKAVVFAGMKNLRNLVAVEALRDFYKGNEGNGFSRENLWLHSATVAILADMIAKRIFSLESEDVFLVGIIHDIGLIVEDQVVAKELREVCAVFLENNCSLTECEKKIIGTDHCEVGFALASDWKLNNAILDAVKHHHGTSRYPLESETSILQLAEYIACRMNYAPIAGSPVSLPPHLAEHVKKMKADYRIIIRDLPEEMAKAAELYHAAE